jgi:hypothetical protein
MRQRMPSCKGYAANLCKCWKCALGSDESRGGSRRLSLGRKLLQELELDSKPYKMAVNFADARKSHILQDFRFPQKFPQGGMYAEALSFTS